MRRHKRRSSRRCRQRIGLFHPRHFRERRAAEEAFEVAAELRGAFVADRKGSFCRSQVVTQHQQSRLVQSRRLQILHRRGIGDLAKVQMKIRHAHLRFLGQGGDPRHGDMTLLDYAGSDRSIA